MSNVTGITIPTLFNIHTRTDVFNLHIKISSLFVACVTLYIRQLFAQSSNCVVSSGNTQIILESSLDLEHDNKMYTSEWFL